MKTTYCVTAIAAFAFALATSAQAHDGHAEETPEMPHYSVVAPFAGGKIKTYVVRSKANGGDERRKKKPEEIGVEIPAEVMNNLPQSTVSMTIEFPMAARGTPFQYMMFDWNPGGHEPPGVYDLPHFDFHFYIQDREDVMEIKPGTCSGLDCEVYAKAMKPVPTQFVAPGYSNVGSVVPYMGNHLIDLGSPEFNGQKFTRTFIYGAYDGEITFYEPMITSQSMIDKPNQCTDLKLPLAYSEDGYYPTRYCTSYDARKKVYRAYLAGFEYRQ